MHYQLQLGFSNRLALLLASVLDLAHDCMRIGRVVLCAITSDQRAIWLQRQLVNNLAICLFAVLACVGVGTTTTFAVTCYSKERKSNTGVRDRSTLRG